MKKLFAIPMALAAVIAMSSAAHAQGALDFAALDADQNGEITLAEFTAAGGTEEGFQFIDTNADGVISAEELDAHNAQSQ